MSGEGNAAAPRFELSYPEGWYQVAYSADVAGGEVVTRRYFGQDLVLFRTLSGQAQVLDAYCAHLGAHLGVGGVVDGERIRCPFHSWAYGTDGLCTEIPYADRIPRGARVRAWSTLERSGLIFVWYSPTAAEPAWEPPYLTEFGDPDWLGYHRHQYLVRSAVQEIIENVFDVAHGKYVHQNAKGTALPVVDFSFDGCTAEARFEIDIPVVGGATNHVAILHGPGIALNRSTGHGTKVFMSTYTPVDPDLVEVNFSFMTPRSTPDDPTGELSARSAKGTVLAFEQDIPIWEHKIYRRSPLFCEGDNSMSRFRVWVRQFYPAASGIDGHVDLNA